jgi:hypothetical protein
VFPVRYGLNFYRLFRINSVFKGLTLDLWNIIRLYIVSIYYSVIKVSKLFLEGLNPWSLSLALHANEVTLICSIVITPYAYKSVSLQLGPGRPGPPRSSYKFGST